MDRRSTRCSAQCELVRSSRQVRGSPSRPFASVVVNRQRTDETQPIAHPQRPRPALPRAHLGRSRAPAAVAAARLDGRLGVVPVPGRRARARLVRDRTGLARLRPERVGRGRLLVPRLPGRPGRAAAAARAGPQRQPGRATAWAATSPTCTPACGPSACASSRCWKASACRAPRPAPHRRAWANGSTRSPTRPPSSPTPRSRKWRSG